MSLVQLLPGADLKAWMGHAGYVSSGRGELTPKSRLRVRIENSMPQCDAECVLSATGVYRQAIVSTG